LGAGKLEKGWKEWFSTFTVRKLNKSQVKFSWIHQGIEDKSNGLKPEERQSLQGDMECKPFFTEGS
jgi:hypothetical protein